MTGVGCMLFLHRTFLPAGHLLPAILCLRVNPGGCAPMIRNDEDQANQFKIKGNPGILPDSE
jgi:hypothetical protein